MNIEKWIDKKKTWFKDGQEVIYSDDLRELLKTHQLVPKEPSEEMIEEGFLKSGEFSTTIDAGQAEIKEIYKAMISAAAEGEI